jgi:hypothetical protein
MVLIGAHTAGTQQFVNPAFAGDAFDSTVNIWDVGFCEFLFVLLGLTWNS